LEIRIGKKKYHTTVKVHTDAKSPTASASKQQSHSVTSTKPESDTPAEPEGHYAKLKKLFYKYGKIAIVVHLTIACISLAGCYALVSMGVDVNKWLSMLGIGGEGSGSAKMGTFAIAYIANKATEVVRLPLTVVLTPIIAKKLNGNKDVDDEDDKDKKENKKSEKKDKEKEKDDD
jgi:hypothetical protein